MIRHFTKQPAAVYVIYEQSLNLSATDFCSKKILFQEYLPLRVNRVSLY